MVNKGYLHIICLLLYIKYLPVSQKLSHTRFSKVLVRNRQSNNKNLENYKRHNSRNQIVVSILNSDIFPNGHSSIRKDRSSDGTEEGVFIAFFNDIILLHRMDFDINCELVCAQS